MSGFRRHVAVDIDEVAPYDPAVSYEAPTWGGIDPSAFPNGLWWCHRTSSTTPPWGRGHLLASYDNTTVITVLAGRPPGLPRGAERRWDALGGFVAGDDVVGVRRQEDLAAMEVLESDHRWLEFSDHQYLEPAARPTVAEVAPELAATIAGLAPTAIFFPMGLGNPDHVMVHEASLQVRAQQPDPVWFCYEDHGYKHIPGLLAWRVAKLLRSHPWPTPAIVPHTPDEARKRRAIWSYTSQIPPLERDHALTARMEGRVP